MRRTAAGHRPAAKCLEILQRRHAQDSCSTSCRTGCRTPSCSCRTGCRTPSCSELSVNIGAQTYAGQLQDSLQDTILQRNACKYCSAGMRRTVCRTTSCSETLVSIGAQACAGQLQDRLQDTVLQRTAYKYWRAGMRRTVAEQAGGRRPAANCL